MSATAHDQAALGRDWVTRRELADRLGVGIWTVDFWVREGVSGVKLGVRYVGGRVRIPLANVDLFHRLVAKRRGRNEP